MLDKIKTQKADFMTRYYLWSIKKLNNIILSEFKIFSSLKPQIVWMTISRRLPSSRNDWNTVEGM